MIDWKGKREISSTQSTNQIIIQVQMSQCSIVKKGLREKFSTRSVNLIATQIQMSQFSIN